MGMQLAHNISISKIELKKKFLASWICSVKFAFFFNVLLRQVSVAPSWSCHALFLLAPNSSDHELSADVSFVPVQSMVLSKYLKRLEIFFSKWYNFHNLLKVRSLQKNISSSFFQYSERTIASTETNNTSAESLWSQLFGGRRTRAWHGQEGATPTCRKRYWKKK